MTATPANANDRPIGGFASFLLKVGATATIGLFYLFVLVSILLLLVVLAVECVLVLAVARFGLARAVTPMVDRHSGLLMIFLRSLWLGKSVEYRIALQREEAPALFDMIDSVSQRVQVKTPRKVYLQMGVSAYVQLKGVRRGANTTFLGLGYDLLAGLTQHEIEGVLAHEMTHAKLVQRGLSQVLKVGLFRAGRLAGSLKAQVAQDRAAGKSLVVISNFMNLADSLTRLAARQVAAYSRQDEFEADRGAAEICGAGAIRSSLLKLEDLERVASRVTLRDRIALLESQEHFDEWLLRELAAANAAGPAETKAEVFNIYATHPSLHDRLAALASYPHQELEPSEPAIRLLADPDKVAADLVTFIQKQLIDQENADSRKLGQWGRKTQTIRHIPPLSALGLFLMIAGGICLLLSPMADTYLVALFSVIAIAGGVACFIYGGRYKETSPLPVPEYALIKEADQKKIKLSDAEVKKLESEVRQYSAHITSRKKRAQFCLEQSHAALGQCDYVRAHMAARFCLEFNSKSIPGHLAFAIAAAALRQNKLVIQALRFVQARTGMKGNSTAWGAGWALALIGDWVYAEVFLALARKEKPNDAGVHALLAIAQLKRGKLFSAINSARKAQELQPQNIGYIKLLVDLLLQGGFLREAHEHLQHMAELAMTDAELAFAMVSLCLSQRNFAVAEEWIAVVSQNSKGAEKYITMAVQCENTRHDALAYELFQHALAAGHYPEAHFGLGRLEAHRQNKEQARAHLTAALDLIKPVGENSIGAVSLVQPILQRLCRLREPVLNCRAWMATLTGTTTAKQLFKTTFVVFAQTEAEGKQEIRDLLAALQPDKPLPQMRWKLAPRERQPTGPVCPGVQYAL